LVIHCKKKGGIEPVRGGATLGAQNEVGGQKSYTFLVPKKKALKNSAIGRGGKNKKTMLTSVVGGAKISEISGDI